VRRALAPLLALLLVVAACGGADDKGAKAPAGRRAGHAEHSHHHLHPHESGGHHHHPHPHPHLDGQDGHHHPY
jgi:hypothetical protein